MDIKIRCGDCDSKLEIEGHLVPEDSLDAVKTLFKCPDCEDTVWVEGDYREDDEG